MNHSGAASGRKAAVNLATTRTTVPAGHPGQRPSAMFGSATFSKRAQQEYLPKEAFDQLTNLVNRNGTLDKSLAKIVAHGMKEWAISQGATHFCHWFHPQTGLTAEKHDSLLSLDNDGVAIERFSGNQLVQGEPDASSLPSGDSRTTFEARGYTIWDPTSPAFILETGGVKTLCIPSHFLSYNGSALDEKTPLLKSVGRLSKVSEEAMKLVSNTEVQVKATVGIEQEYFLIDKAFGALRPDLILCGRTMSGASPAKGQELDDHYFGSIKPRVLTFMSDLDTELIKLGIPVQTRHNEVAPMQFELAPFFEEAHIAADHNQLIMQTAKAVAERHNFLLLLHEKPFKGMNGSGKHINWSLQTETGLNLFKPGKNKEDNIRFLYFVCAFLEGVYKRGDLLRASVATAANDHRLGQNEAPPAIMSVYLGEEITSFLEELTKDQTISAAIKTNIQTGIDHLSEIKGASTDRNRTSPIAFTGNKFEFRACGSSQSTGLPITILNGAAAEGLSILNKELKTAIESGKEREEAILSVLQTSARKTESVRFDGNCYDESWVIEAQKRGLPNLANSPAAMKAFSRQENIFFLSEYQILSPQETEVRRRVKLNRYVQIRTIECQCLEDIVATSILPALFEYRNIVAPCESLRRVSKYLETIDDLITDLLQGQSQLEGIRLTCGNQDQIEEKATFISENLLPAFESVRNLCDTAERILPDHLWGLPKYREMLFLM